MPKKERREFIRLQAYHCVKYRLLSTVDTQAHPFTASTVKDISGGGICLRTEELLPESSLIELKINFPHISTYLSVVAKVVWIKPRDRIRRYDIGMRFMDIDELLRKIIEGQVKMVYGRINKKR